MLHTPQARRLDTTSVVGNLPWPRSRLYTEQAYEKRFNRRCRTCICTYVCTTQIRTDARTDTYLLANLLADLFLAPVRQHPNVRPPRPRATQTGTAQSTVVFRRKKKERNPTPSPDDRPSVCGDLSSTGMSNVGRRTTALGALLGARAARVCAGVCVCVRALRESRRVVSCRIRVTATAHR
jgi:hypothetical protein